MKRSSCEECGALLDSGAERCTLCGWPVSPGIAGVETAPELRPDVAAARLSRVPCGYCNWKNPAVARFCSQCGSPLQSEDAAVQAPDSRSAVPRQVAIMMGAALSLVIALFLVTAVSKSGEPAATQTSIGASEPVVAPPEGTLAAEVAELDERIAQAEGTERLLRQREKLLRMLEADRTDLAAVEQQRVAESTGDVGDWKLAGDLYYEAMRLADSDPVLLQQMAGLAVAAYEHTLELDPDNLDVRTDMATAYLNTGNPMKGVDEIKRVLELDPSHLNANLNYGLMLYHINRVDQAVEQLEKVIELAEEDSEHYRRARAVLADIGGRAGP